MRGEILSKQHPVDTGIENAKSELEEASDGEFKVSEESITKLQTILRKIWEENISDGQIPEEFVAPLFELVALAQFQRTKRDPDSAVWDLAELELLVNSLWKRLKEFLNPPTPNR